MLVLHFLKKQNQIHNIVSYVSSMYLFHFECDGG